MIEQGLKTLLLLDPTVSNMISGRSYGVILPQDPTWPAIVMTTITGTDSISTNGAVDPAEGRFQINCWSTSLSEVRTLSKAIRAVLSGYKGAAGDELIQGSFLNDSGGETYDQEIKAYKRQLDFNVFYSEVLTAADLRKGTLKIIDSEQVEILVPGTPINPSSNTAAVYVRIINNSDNLVLVGMQETGVDALADPVKGYALLKYMSRLFAVVDNASNVYIDAAIANTKVSVELFARN